MLSIERFWEKSDERRAFTEKYMTVSLNCRVAMLPHKSGAQRLSNEPSTKQNKKHQHFMVPLRDERGSQRNHRSIATAAAARAPIATELIVKTAVGEREDVGEAWRAEKRFKYEIITFSRDSVCPSFAFTRATHYTTRYMQVHTSTCGEADWSDAWSEH